MGYRSFYGGSYLYYAPRSRPSRRNVTRSLRRRKRRSIRKIGAYHAVQPYSIVRKLKTVYATAQDPAAGTLASNLIALNDAKDPLGPSSATQQPLGFDQYEALYNKYCVIGWKVKVEAVTVDNSNALYVGFTPTTASTALTSYSHYKECPGTVSRILSPDIDKAVFSTKGSVKKQMLRRGKILTDDTLYADVTASPTRILYGHIWSHVMDATDPANTKIVVTLEQLVVFFDPKIPARSTQ